MTTTRILHFSDPHVQLRDWRTRPLRELGPLRALATVELWKGRGKLFDRAEEELKKIGKLALTFDHAICTGDLTQLGLREEMQLARAALEPLASDARKLTALPGNHDRFPRNGRPVYDFEACFPEQAASDLPAFSPLRIKLLGPPGGVALLVIESAVPYSWPVISRGKIEPEAIAQLARALAHPEVKSRCALVLTHHAPLRRNGRKDFPLHYLGNADAFMQAARDGGAAAIVAGHVHERFEHAANAKRPRILCVGSATDAREPGAYALKIEDGKLVDVETITF